MDFDSYLWAKSAEQLNWLPEIEIRVSVELFGLNVPAVEDVFLG